jgi:hypothetical protein
MLPAGFAAVDCYCSGGMSLLWLVQHRCDDLFLLLYVVRRYYDMRYCGGLQGSRIIHWSTIHTIAILPMYCIIIGLFRKSIINNYWKAPKNTNITIAVHCEKSVFRHFLMLIDDSRGFGRTLLFVLLVELWSKDAYKFRQSSAFINYHFL